MQAQMQIFFDIFQKNSCFSRRFGGFFQKTQHSQERSGNHPLHRATKTPRLPHQPFTAAQRNSAQRNIIHQPPQHQPNQRVAPQQPVADRQKKIKTQHRTHSGVQQILRQQIKPRAPGLDDQAHHAEHIIQHTQRKTQPQAEQKQPRLFGQAQQIHHQRNTLLKKPPPAVFGAVSW